MSYSESIEQNEDVVLYIVYCLFVLFHFAIVLSVLFGLLILITPLISLNYSYFVVAEKSRSKLMRWWNKVMKLMTSTTMPWWQNIS